MNRALVDPIANAVLYEGYLLYPYRPSVKNRQRWTFGGLYPEASRPARAGEPSRLQTECLVAGSPTTAVEAVVRFLHLSARVVGECIPALHQWPEEAAPEVRLVESLQVDGRVYHTWQEAEEREVAFAPGTLQDLSDRPRVEWFAFPGATTCEPIRDRPGTVPGVLVRVRHPLAGEAELSAGVVEPGLYRVTLRVVNRSPVTSGDGRRETAPLHALNSTHVILAAIDGAFISLRDPPDRWRDAAAACLNIGVWPVLVGAEGMSDLVLAPPIILYDNPKVAPESPGDFFDGTEIDEMLTLRILTLTDQEKSAMAAVDDRARALLARTESQSAECRGILHGALRELRPVAGEDAHG